MKIMKTMENPKMGGTELFEKNISTYMSICLLDIFPQKPHQQLKATMAFIGPNPTQHLSPPKSDTLQVQCCWFLFLIFVSSFYVRFESVLSSISTLLPQGHHLLSPLTWSVIVLPEFPELTLASPSHASHP